MGRGRGPEAGSGAGHGPALERLCLEERDTAVQEQGESVPGCHQLPCGTDSTVPGLLPVLVSHPFFLP